MIRLTYNVLIYKIRQHIVQNLVYFTFNIMLAQKY
jgi:hypothetical protein